MKMLPTRSSAAVALYAILLFSPLGVNAWFWDSIANWVTQTVAPAVVHVAQAVADTVSAGAEDVASAGAAVGEAFAASPVGQSIISAGQDVGQFVAKEADS